MTLAFGLVGFIFDFFFSNPLFLVVDYAVHGLPEVSYTLVLGCGTKNET